MEALVTRIPLLFDSLLSGSFYLFGRLYSELWVLHPLLINTSIVAAMRWISDDDQIADRNSLSMHGIPPLHPNPGRFPQRLVTFLTSPDHDHRHGIVP